MSLRLAFNYRSLPSRLCDLLYLIPPFRVDGSSIFRIGLKNPGQRSPNVLPKRPMANSLNSHKPTPESEKQQMHRKLNSTSSESALIQNCRKSSPRTTAIRQSWHMNCGIYRSRRFGSPKTCQKSCKLRDLETIYPSQSPLTSIDCPDNLLLLANLRKT
jgi:hypothetical protein